jgi:predicted O-methyltransferase YrrM
MKYQYPEHFKYPNERIFFTDHIDLWEDFLGQLKNKPNVTLEIGALYGGSSVYILEEYCKSEGSHHYIMDINTNEFIENNIEPYTGKVSYLLGESADAFKVLEHNGLNKEFLDLIYIDGNHMSKYVLEDAINSFYCLKNGGYMIFDDFGGGWEQERHLQVKTAVESFVHSYDKHIDVIHRGYQFIVRKKEYINNDEFIGNYYKTL